MNGLRPGKIQQSSRLVAARAKHFAAAPRISAPLSKSLSRRLGAFGLWLMLVLGFSGCVVPQPGAPVLASSYRPQNVYSWGAGLPPVIRRVAMLPMACDPANPDMLAGRETLEPIMRDELIKTRRFETVAISPEALQARTGRFSWGCEEELPHDLFSWLLESRGCDAVLFCRLTVFRGYSPLAVGWRIRLVDLRTRATVWAGDEIFDADQPSVQAGARRYLLAGCLPWGPRPDDWAIENSPRQFGQYAAARLLASLPGW